jgi:glutaredoxin-like YruB-family protein
MLDRVPRRVLGEVMALKVYTTPNCPWCREAKTFLEAKGLAFEEVDVTKDRRRIEELQELSGQLGVPVITDGKTTIVGFDKPALEKLAAALG